MLQTSKLELVHRFWLLNMRCGNGNVVTCVFEISSDKSKLAFGVLLYCRSSYIAVDIPMWPLGENEYFKENFQRAGLIELHIFKLEEYCPILTQYQPSNNQYHTILTLYHQVSCSTALNWRSTTKLESVSPYTDPVPLSTIQYCPMLTQYHYVPFINALYWPSTTDYQHYHLYWPNTTKYQRTPPPPEGLF